MAQVTDTDKRFVQLDEIRTQFIESSAHKLRAGFKIIAEAENPQDLMDKYGADAAQFFADFMDARALLVSMGATGLPEPSGSFTPNTDGTVTFTAPEPEQLPSDEGV